jgi:hypothetical protein
MRCLLCLSFLLLCPLAARPQKFMVGTNGPQECTQFHDLDVAHLDPVETVEYIGEEEFRQAYAKKPASEPDTRFTINKVIYSKPAENNFIKETFHDDKAVEFVKWYNRGGEYQMSRTAKECINSLLLQVTNSNDRNDTIERFRTVLTQMLAVLERVRTAGDTESKTTAKMLSGTLRQQIETTEKYNHLVGDYNELIQHTQQFIDNAVMPYVRELEDSNAQLRAASRVPTRTLPKLFFPPPAREITCTGNAQTFIFSNAQAADTTPDMHCSEQ